MTSLQDSAFTNHSIVIELSGPDVPDVTLIDLPGIFRAIGEDQTKKDMNQVRALTEKYVKESRTLILAVVSGGDLQTSEIIQLARENDPKFERTIVVITKPDLLEVGTESSEIQQAHRMGVPFHVVLCRSMRQRDEEHISAKDFRERERTFFASNPVWANVDTRCLTVESLQSRLSDLMAERVHNQLPKVKADLIAKHADLTSALERLGPDCSDAAMRRLVFHQSSERLITLLASICKRQYDDVAFFDSEENRVRAVVRIEQRRFSDEILHIKELRESYEEGDFALFEESLFKMVGDSFVLWMTVRSSLCRIWRNSSPWNRLRKSVAGGKRKRKANENISRMQPSAEVLEILNQINSFRGEVLSGFV